MILFFHLVCLITRYIVNNISKSIRKHNETFDNELNPRKSVAVQPSFFAGKDFARADISDTTGVKFIPPVYIQRYEAVSSILKEDPWKGKIRKVIDVGCAEMSFFRYLKDIRGLQEVLEVDVDEDLLQRSFFKVAPLQIDFLSQLRFEPLNVYVLSGSITEYDKHLKGIDAVIGIELIEHLDSKTLEKLPYNVFHLIKPRLAIFTTPNAEFNVLFPNLTSFRHDDHKFEWTRKEFFNWTQGITAQYPEYSVRFYGIGEGPVGTENLGCCSQMAVFERSENISLPIADFPNDTSNYKLIKKYEYPYYVDNRTKKEKILQEVQYRLVDLALWPQFYDEDEAMVLIPLTNIFHYVDHLCSSLDELRDIVSDGGMSLCNKGGDYFINYTNDRMSSEHSDDEFWVAQNGDEELVENGKGITSDVEGDWDHADSNFHKNRHLEVENSGNYSDHWDDDQETLKTQEKQTNLVKCRNDVSESRDSKAKIENIDKCSEAGALPTPVTGKTPSFVSFEETKEDDDDEVGIHKELKIGENKILTDATLIDKVNKEKKPQGLSKIPRKRHFTEVDKKRACSPVIPAKLPNQFNSKPMVRPHSSYVRKSPRKISKSFSLDSCLENINCEPYEVQAFYLNLISSGACSTRCANSLLATGRLSSSKFLVSDSGSPVIDSNSCEKAIDSGYPFSFSPHDTDLTPEQVDELVTENELAKSSTSEDSLSEDEELIVDVVGPRNPHDLFFEEVIVENGDVANNNRDGEGNNVEGLEGEVAAVQNNIVVDLEVDPNDNVLMLIPENEDPFPPWLLNLVELAQQPVIVPFEDEGLGDDSSSDGIYSDLVEI